MAYLPVGRPLAGNLNDMRDPGNVRRVHNWTRPYTISMYRLSKLFTWVGLESFLNREFDQIPQGARVLMVGADGPIARILSRYAHRSAFEVVGFDIDPLRGPSVVGDLCSAPFRSGAFDVAVLGEVLEHVHSPQLAIDGIHRLLAPGGRLILTTPFLFPIHERPRDYYRFTRYGLEWLLRNFRSVTVAPRGTWAEAINAMGVRLFMEPELRPRLLAPFVMIVAIICLPLARLIGRLVPSDFLTIGYTVTALR